MNDAVSLLLLHALSLSPPPLILMPEMFPCTFVEFHRVAR